MINFPLTNLMCKYTHKKPTLQYLNEEIEALKKWKNEVSFIYDLEAVTSLLESINNTVNNSVNTFNTTIDNVYNDLNNIILNSVNKLNFEIQDTLKKITQVNSALNNVRINYLTIVKDVVELQKLIQVTTSLPDASLESPTIVIVYNTDGECNMYCKKEQLITVFRNPDNVWVNISNYHNDIVSSIPENSTNVFIEKTIYNEYSSSYLFRYFDGDIALGDVEAHPEHSIDIDIYFMYSDIAETLLQENTSVQCTVEKLKLFSYNKVF